MPPWRLDQAARGKIPERDALIVGREGPNLGDRLPIDGDDHPLTALRPPENGRHVVAEVTDPDRERFASMGGFVGHEYTCSGTETPYYRPALGP